MADQATFIFFRSGRGDLDLAARVLAERGMSVERLPREFGAELGHAGSKAALKK